MKNSQLSTKKNFTWSFMWSLFLTKRLRLKLSEIYKMIKKMQFHIGSQAPKVPPKIAISHIFVISGGNILYDKAQEIFLFSFPGRVPVIFHWISEGLCNSSFIEEIFNIKNWKKRSTWVFFTILWTPWSWKENFHNLKCP